MKAALKRSLMWAYNHALVPAAVVTWAFKKFDLKGS
jgi:hypothetical protein